MNIRKIIKEEIDDFDWAKDVDPYQFVKDYYEKITTNPKKRIKYMMGDYYHLKSERYSREGWSPKRLREKMGVPDTMSDEDFIMAVRQYIKDNTNLIKRFLGFMSYDEGNYDMDVDVEDWWDGHVFNRVNESDDFDWVKETPLHSLYIGMKFTENPKIFEDADDTIYYISDIDDNDIVYIMGDDLDSPITLRMEYIINEFENGGYIPVNLNESNDFEWTKTIEPHNIISVPNEFENYLDGRIELTSNLNILINDRSRDWYEYLGEYTYHYYITSGKNIPMLDFSLDRLSSLGIQVVTGIGDNLKKMFGEPIYHDHFGEGFDGEFDHDLEEYGEPEIPESHASYMLDINSHIIHVGFDHRGVSISVPSDLSPQVVCDDIMKPIITKYIDTY